MKTGPHAAQLGVKANQTRNVGFTVLERINVTFGGVFDEIAVKDLPAAFLVKNPLGVDLVSLVQPSRIPLVRPPTAAPVRAASAGMMETSTGALPN